MKISGIVHRGLRHDFIQSSKNISSYCQKYAIFSKWPPFSWVIYMVIPYSLLQQVGFMVDLPTAYNEYI